MEKYTGKKSDFKDKNDIDIHDGDTIVHQNRKYVVMNVDKDEIGWIAHPIAGNRNTIDVPLVDIAIRSEII